MRDGDEARSDIQRVAEKLARHNAEAAPGIEKVYLFPAEEIIYLLEIDQQTMPSEEDVVPFFFGADDKGGIPYPSGIAMIRPQEYRNLALPAGWGNWDDAKLIWQRQ